MRKLFQEILDEFPSDLRAQAQADLDYLANAHAGSYEALLELVRTSGVDLKARIIACWILGKLRNKKAAQALLVAFQDQDTNLLWEAAKALSSLGSKRAVNPLITALLKAPSAERRAAAAYALGHLQDKRAIDPLLKVLNTTEEEARVRGHVAEALAKFKDPQIVGPLIKALKDKAPEVRFWSAYALGQFGDRRALPKLKYLVQNDHTHLPNWWKISEEASKAIHNISYMS
jgi:HEAT repeat protein